MGRTNIEKIIYLFLTNFERNIREYNEIYKLYYNLYTRIFRSKLVKIGQKRIYNFFYVSFTHFN